MKLIRDFDLTELMAIAESSELPLVLREGSLEVTGDAPVDMVLPPFNPKLVRYFRAFQVLNEVPDDTIYLAGMTANGKYQHFEAGAWVVTDDPVFQSPDNFRAGLTEWIGPFQVTLRIMPLGRLWKVLLGYEVTLDLLDFMVRNSLPQYLEVPTQYSLPASFVSGKGIVGLPPMDYLLSTAGISKMQFQSVSGTRSPVTAVVSVEGGHQVTLRDRLSGSGYLHFEFTPKVNFAEEGTFYQIEELPSVIIRRKESSEVGYPYLVEVSQGATDDFTSTALSQVDLLIEVIVVAASEGMGQAIAYKLLSKIRESARLDVSAFGMSFGVMAMSGVKSNRNNQSVKGTTPKISFDIAVRNIILMTS